MNIDLQSTFRNDDLEAWKIFIGDHAFAHSTIARNIARIYSSNIIDFPLSSVDNMGAWLQTHDTIHRSICATMGLDTPPDLSTVDFTKRSQFTDWMYNHQLLHDQITQVLGI